MRLPLWRRRQDEELDEELAAHLRMAIADRIDRGESPDDAARAAFREFGNVSVIREVTRDAWGWTRLEQAAQDVRYGLRALRRAPGFTLVAVLTLALGIGANTAMFSVINAVLLRPLPFPDPGRLVAVSEVDFRRVPGGTPLSVSWPDFFDWRTRAQVFQHLSAYRSTNFTVAGGPQPLHLDGAVVSSDLFATLGVQPSFGRGFRIEEERAGADVVIISDELWTSRFGRSADAVGRTVTINSRPFTIIGVMPPRFRFPITSSAAQLWVTVAEDARVDQPDDSPMTQERGAHFLKVVGRVGPDVTIATAQTELDVIARTLGREHPDENGGHGVRVTSQLESLVGSRRRPLFMLLSAVGCVLLIACVNLANLLLARGAGRHRELSVRAALGASPLRIVSQLLTESVVLSVLGTACGLLLAYCWIALVVRLSPVDIRGLDEATIDRAVLTFTAAVAVASALLFGIIPALQAARADLTLGLQGSRSATAGRSHRQLRAVLVVAETALGVVLLIGAGLLLRNFSGLLRTSPGFDPHHVITARFSLPDARYPYLKQVAFYDDLLSALAQSHGVQSAAAVVPLPLSGSRMTISFELPGSKGTPADKQSATFGVASPGYFRAMRIPLVRGREFRDADNDGAPRVVIVNESFARTYFPGQDPIGRRIKPGLATTERETPWREVVGVVADNKHEALAESGRPAYFVPYAQGLISSLSLVVRATDDRAAQGIVDEIRDALAKRDPELALYDTRPLETYVAASMDSERFETLLLAILAGIGLVLTAVGLYGVLAYAVALRTREFGIRLALGARPGTVLGMVVRSGIVLAGSGLVIGLALGAVATRAIASALTGIDPLDPLTFAGVAALLSGVAALASYVPARRATRVDPISALRAE